MTAELRPRQLLDELLERAEPAGKRHEGVGSDEHELLALVHVVNDDQLLRLDQHLLALAQETRDDADDVAAVIEHGAGDLAHEAEAAPAIDEADAGSGKPLPEFPRRLGVSRVSARARPAIDADILQSGGDQRFIHGQSSGIGLKCASRKAPVIPMAARRRIR